MSLLCNQQDNNSYCEDKQYSRDSKDTQDSRKSGIKSALKKICVGINIAAYTCALGLAGMAIKNVYECKPQTNLEYHLTKSDLKQMQYLDSMIDTPKKDFSEFGALTTFNGYEAVMLHLAFHSYAMTNIALSDSSKKQKASDSIDKAIEKYLCGEMRTNVFYSSNEHSNIKDLEFTAQPDVKNNLFYYSNLNLMVGAFKLVSGSDKYDELHDTLTESISEAFDESGGINLNSMPGLSWTADNTVALASLKLYDKINNTDISSENISSWKKWVESNMLDEDGNLYSMMCPLTKKPDAPPRGSNFAYSLIFMNMFDSAFSSKLYDNFAKSFYQPILGVELAKEWKDGSNKIDVDSGPILFGAGAVASAFAMGAAKAHNDESRFSSLSLAAELVTLPYESMTKKGYLFNISLGESVLLFCRTLKPWTS